MFGYVIARKDTLSESEQARYRACYCGLCRALKERHGNLSRLALNYDMTFLILVLSSLYEPEEQSGSARCAVHPARPRAFWQNDWSDYAADMNVALTWHKLRDDWLDEGARLQKGLMDQLQDAYDRVKARRPRQCAAMERELDALLALEKAEEPVPDKPAACFGRLMAAIFTPEEDRWAPVLGEMAFWLGQFIYLADACEDLQKDAKKGSYNPLLAMNGGQVRPAAAFEPMLVMLAAQCYAAFDRLPLVQDCGILGNILRDGIWSRYHQLRAKEEQKEKKEGAPV